MRKDCEGLLWVYNEATLGLIAATLELIAATLELIVVEWFCSRPKAVQGRSISTGRVPRALVVGESWSSMSTCLWLRQRFVDGLVGPLLLVAVHAAGALVDARVVCLPRGAWRVGEWRGGWRRNAPVDGCDIMKSCQKNFSVCG